MASFSVMPPVPSLNTVALAISAKTTRYLTNCQRGVESDISRAVELGRDLQHEAYTRSAEAFNQGEDLCDAFVAAFMGSLSTTAWYDKHGETAHQIAGYDLHDKIQWVEDTPKMVLMVNGKALKRVSSKNATLYAAYRTVSNPEYALCSLALSLPSLSHPDAYTATTKMEMHWERVVTTQAALDHAKLFLQAVETLKALLI